ncbi:probable protein phosphatase 2C 4 [Impatiens glandulifera]|uniref:probable protein phosphatase 2C 4 n=1 Tax=Impatiens glandulifera TaxID=253017 RepID=UPI001FB1753C|nr:probable protein phosphatase 2C 4 [Impatiens glandulifera]
MGNKIGRLKVCFTCDVGEISLRRHDISISDEGFGHSFCYFPPESSSDDISSFQDISLAKANTFKSISGASLSANVYTPLSTAPVNLSSESSCSSSDKASSFESSDSFASIPLQPIPRTSVSSFYSGPISADSGTVSVMGLVERGFLSGPIERSFFSDPFDRIDSQFDQSNGFKPISKKRAFVRNLKKVIANSIIVPIRAVKESDWTNRSSKNNPIDNFNLNFSRQESFIDESFQNQKVQWAQGKAGEDRVHVVISDEHEWVFVGIYDGFNGPDATDFLLGNLYSNVQEELKGLLLLNERSSELDRNHSKILAALGNALRKTEESYLQISDMMLVENPELSLMGSCVLAMIMKGEDVYLMNVGDSRAVLARRIEPEVKPRKDLGRIKEETSYDFDFDESNSSFDLSALQLTVDHSTSMEEEVKRIKKEHPEDPYAISNGRVKASLKVTRAFGAGFLKKPKWNNSLLKMFRIDYIGNSPYINCLPSLYHHKLGPKDRFLVLSSDGLYQYFTNEEAIVEIERFLSSFPEGDPAQHLIEEILFRAAKKAGMDFHELLDIPQGDRRRYHDDVSIIIISFEGRIWRSNM